MSSNTIPSNVDCNILGTGLTKSIVEAACSRVGKTTVQHLDKSVYYDDTDHHHDQYAPFTFQQLVDWIKLNHPNEQKNLADVRQELLDESRMLPSQSCPHLSFSGSSSSSSSGSTAEAVTTAEEYAAKIFKLQQACLTPLKEDLADWLNKIMNLSTITSKNFMHKLDNGVIICHLARIISIWCEKMLVTDLSHNHAISNMIQTKIWEDARSRTFYARDNVSNFLRWTRGFGVNKSVLFESDDLVLHANPRQVVLCLLDVARIACVKHGFTEAPGLVKFEQEIDRELAAEREAAENASCRRRSEEKDTHYDKLVASSGGQIGSHRSGGSNNNNKKLPGRGGRNESATDELILRYCKFKEEEAVRKKAEAAATAIALSAETKAESETELLKEEIESSHCDDGRVAFDPDSLLGSPDDKDSGTSTTKSPIGGGAEPQTRSTTNGGNHLNYDYRVDSLDSGEGRTESASTSHSKTPVNNNRPQPAKSQSAIPVPIKQQQQQRSGSSSSLSRASSITTSELSSSRSSLLSNQDSGTAGNKRHLASSDLDGKVMRIAKSYYGKGAKRGVTRLSEGKYRIADRIVFVRLLKGHRVMVRIGGGWDTLENFLFRHKSDPSQVIDVDNLLPIEAKMTFEKGSSSHLTMSPASGLHKQYSRLPYNQQRRSSSASSTNLSLSVDLSVVSPTLSSVNGGGSSSITTAASTISTGHAICTPLRRISYKNRPPNRQESMPESVPLPASARHQTPFLLIHRANNQQHSSKHPATPYRANSVQSSSSSMMLNDNQAKSGPLRKLSGAHIGGNRPLGNSKTPTASSTNLYPATLTTNRVAHSAPRPFGHHSNRLMNGSTSNLMSSNYTARGGSKQETFRKMGCSSDSLQVSYLRTPRNYGNFTTTNNNGSHSRNNAIMGGQKFKPKPLPREAKA